MYIFLSGLEKNTKIHLQLFNPPANLAEAFRREKKFQSVNKTVKSQEPSVFLAKLEKLDNIVEKLNSFTQEAIFQPSISPDLRGKQGVNLSCSIDEGEKLSSVNNDVDLLEKQINYSLKKLSSLNNDDDSLEKQINFRLNTSASNNDLENPPSTQKFKGEVKDCDDNNNKNNNFNDEDINCYLVTNNDVSAKISANDHINNFWRHKIT